MPVVALADDVWRAAPATDSYNTAGNWVGNTVPTDGATAVFGPSNTTSVAITSTVSPGAFQFNAGAPAYSFAVAPATQLQLTGLGIVNNSSNRPTIATNSSSVNLAGSASLGNASVINGSSGAITFRDRSSAGNGAITNNFFGETQFFDTATAGNATITTNRQGGVQFNDSSTAGNATFITNAQGSVIFAQGSNGGQARFINNGGTLDFGIDTLGAVTAGSIEGSGRVFIGSNRLTVGSNNLSTTISGDILDNLDFPDSRPRGSLVKVGSGTLTLTGNNVIGGGITVSAGVLQGNTSSLRGSVTNNAAVLFDQAAAGRYDGDGPWLGQAFEPAVPPGLEP